MSRIEVLSGPERRRRWSAEEKRSIVAEAFAPGGSVCAVAGRRDGFIAGGMSFGTRPRDLPRWWSRQSRTSDRRRARRRWRSNSAGTFGFGLQRRRPRSWRRRSSGLWRRDDPVFDRGSGVDCGRPYRHEAWDVGLVAAGSGGAEARSARRRSLLVSRPRRFADQDSLA